MLPARALFYALIISLLMAMLSGSLISLSYMQGLQQTDQFEEERLIRNLQSGIALVQASNGEIPLQAIDLFGSRSDSVLIQRFNWGLFDVGYVQAFQTSLLKGKILDKTFFMGEAEDVNLSPALYLSDQNASLALAGNTLINGDAYLPRAGVKSGFVNGSGYTGKEYIHGEKKISGTRLPSINEKKIEAILSHFHIMKPERGIEQSIQPFNGDTKFITGASIFLDRVQLSGKIAVVAKDSIFIGMNAQIKDILVFAPRIIIERGFSGSLQAFATESIVVGEGCQLIYPSALGLIKPQKINNQPVLEIGEDSHIQGLVLVYQKYHTRFPPILRIKENVLVEGQVWADAAVDLKGSVHGNISCTSFSLRTSSSVYNNHLYHATIDRRALKDAYLNAFISSSPKKSGIAQWIEYE